MAPAHTPALVCRFPDKVRFYDQVIKQAEPSLFVETDRELRAGALVSVAIELQAQVQVMTAQARVVGTRPKARGDQPAGVWIRFDGEQIDALLEHLQVVEGEGAVVTTRRHPRYPCALPVLIDKPIRQSFRTVNISEQGACLDDTLAAPIGQTIHFTIELADGTLSLFGRVAWRRDDQRLTGIEFRFPNEHLRRAVHDEVRRIADEQAFMVFAKPTVLVVDDDAGILHTLERVLTTRGYGTLTAASGPEALSTARARAPGLILLDVLLPGMNGLEVCRALKRDAGTSGIPVVLSSMLAADELAMLVRESGALGGIAKPYSLETLCGLVAQVLDERGSRPSPEDEGESEKRRGKRVPLFERCTYESESLHIETYVREASQDGASIVSCWGEPVGTRGRLTLTYNVASPVQLDVQVVHRTSWGVVQGRIPDHVHTLGLELVGHSDGERGAGDFARWLAGYQESLEGKPIILLVDDDRAHLELLAITLRHAGFGVVTLDSPHSVSSAMVMSQPVLVIVDYMMPGLDGATVCRVIKGNHPDVTVLLYSSVSEEHLEALARDAGADGFIRKGVSLLEIARRISALLG